LDRCADSISTPLVKSVTSVWEVGNLLCAIHNTLRAPQERELRDRRLRRLGWILFNQLGHDRRKLCPHPAPVGDTVVLQID
jgi:hypothetical protein